MTQCEFEFRTFEQVFCLQHDGAPQEYLQGTPAYFDSAKKGNANDNDEEAFHSRQQCRFINPSAGADAVGASSIGNVLDVFLYDDCLTHGASLLRLNRGFRIRTCFDPEDSSLHALEISEPMAASIDDGRPVCLPGGRAWWWELLEAFVMGCTFKRQSGLYNSLLIGSFSLNLVFDEDDDSSADALLECILRMRPCRLLRLSPESLNALDCNWLPVMDSAGGLVQASLLQAPHNHLFVIDETGMHEGQLGPVAMARIHALQDLVLHQRIEIRQASSSSSDAIITDQDTINSPLAEIIQPFPVLVSNPVVVLSRGCRSLFFPVSTFPSPPPPLILLVRV